MRRILLPTILMVFFIAGCSSPYTSLDQCRYDCQSEGYPAAGCFPSGESPQEAVALGECQIRSSPCNQLQKCLCYCFGEEEIKNLSD